MSRCADDDEEEQGEEEESESSEDETERAGDAPENNGVIFLNRPDTLLKGEE